MISVNNKILVKVDSNQKNEAIIGGNKLMMGKLYTTNNREKNPVIAKVISGNEEVNGEHILVHHNIISGEHCPYHLQDGFYSIPYKETTVFAKIDDEGNAQPICGNIISERIKIPTEIPVPPEYEKVYLDRCKVITDGYGYKKGQIVFVIPYSCYEICFTWNSIERRIIKIYRDDILAVYNEN